MKKKNVRNYEKYDLKIETKNVYSDEKFHLSWII